MIAHQGQQLEGICVYDWLGKTAGYMGTRPCSSKTKSHLEERCLGANQNRPKQGQKEGRKKKKVKEIPDRT